MANTKSMLTNSSDELSLAKLLGSGGIFSIPFFQRPYKWAPDKIRQLNDDILSLMDVPNDVHFLGAIITHGLARSNSADVSVSEVIDGQQRLTTVYLYVCAAVKTLIDAGEPTEAQGLFEKFLTIQINTKSLSNLALHSSQEDRKQLNAIVDEILESKAFAKFLGGFTFKKLTYTSSGPDRSILRNNYNSAKRFFKEQLDQGGVARVLDASNALLERMTLVQIEIQDPTNGPKIFNSLNSRQEPMTIGDLVRNDIFSRGSAEDAETIARIDEEEWQPFYRGFMADRLGKMVNNFDSYFFPFGLVHNPNTTKSDVYTKLNERWVGKSPSEVIAELADYQADFMAIITGINTTKHPKEIAAAFKRLTLLGAPSSTYPFLMQVSRAVRESAMAEADALEILALVEAFLIRRALCAIEPTGLHAVFKKLWDDCGSTVDATAVRVAMKKHKTVKWPSDDEVKESVATLNLYKSGICKFLILELERRLGGDSVGIEPWIEHILPEAWTAKDWPDVSKEEHLELKDVIGNLLPLSAEMNKGLSNSAFASKRGVYAADSAFKSARELASTYSTWTADDIRHRGVEIGDWAVQQWTDPSIP